MIRGALDERPNRSDLVFVPSVGFRPPDTRVLGDAAETYVDATNLRAVAIAASPDATDLIVEWTRQSDVADCTPGQYLSALAPQPPELSTAQLAYGDVVVRAESITRGSFAMGMNGIHAFHAIRFPALPSGVSEVELRVNEGEHRFIVPLHLVPAAPNARVVEGTVTHADVTVRTTSMAWHADEVVIGVEVSSAWSVHQVGAPLPPQPEFRGVGDEVRRARAKEMRRVFGDRVDPLRLELPDGTVLEEIRRIYTVRPTDPSGAAIVQRFVVAFPAPLDARDGTLIVPFVELSDHTVSVEVDLRALPAQVALGRHAFTVLSAEPYGSETKVVAQLHPDATDRMFVQPASFVGSGGSYSWNREADGRVWFAGAVGDPPIIRFIGVVERVRGPWRVPVVLAR